MPHPECARSPAGAVPDKGVAVRPRFPGRRGAPAARQAVRERTAWLSARRRPPAAPSLCTSSS
jgi:hypothetical protein